VVLSEIIHKISDKKILKYNLDSSCNRFNFDDLNNLELFHYDTFDENCQWSLILINNTPNYRVNLNYFRGPKRSGYFHILIEYLQKTLKSITNVFYLKKSILYKKEEIGQLIKEIQFFEANIELIDDFLYLMSPMNNQQYIEIDRLYILLSKIGENIKNFSDSYFINESQIILFIDYLLNLELESMITISLDDLIDFNIIGNYHNNYLYFHIKLGPMTICDYCFLKNNKKYIMDRLKKDINIRLVFFIMDKLNLYDELIGTLSGKVLKCLMC